MTELILIRHGETESNKKGAYLGWTDVKLSIEGIMQAYKLKERLASVKPDIIVSSPLKRAAETACIINEQYNMAIQYENALKERGFGVWDNLTYEEIIAGYKDEYEEWIKDWLYYPAGGGESTLDVYNRITGCIQKIIDNNKGKSIMVVTHLGCIRNLIAYLLGFGIDASWRFRVDNGSISRICINDEGYAYLTLLNG